MPSTWDTVPPVFQNFCTEAWIKNGMTQSELTETQEKVALALSKVYGGPEGMSRAFSDNPDDLPIFTEGNDYPPDDIPCSVYAKGSLRIFFAEERSPVPGYLSFWFGRTTDPRHKGTRRDCIDWMPDDFELKVCNPKGDWVEMYKPRRFIGGVRIRVSYDVNDDDDGNGGGGGRRTQEVVVPYMKEPNVDAAVFLVNNA